MRTDKLLLVVGVALIRDAPWSPGSGESSGSSSGVLQVLVAQRPKGKANEGLWEFPGGKVGAWGQKQARGGPGHGHDPKPLLAFVLTTHLLLTYLLTLPFLSTSPAHSSPLRWTPGRLLRVRQ